MFDIVRQLLADPPAETLGAVARAGIVVDALQQNGLYPEFSRVDAGVNRPEVVIEGSTYLHFAANNYLSLSEHPEVIRASVRATEQYGVGPGGSRVVSGNVSIIEEVERRIARLTGCEACLTFPTGYMANVTVFQAVMNPFLGGLPFPKKDGLILVDAFAHGSIFDGCKLAGVQVVKFKHNDLDNLRRKLDRYPHLPNKLIVTEGVYCLEGEIIDIPAYLEVAGEFGALLMVDDAHAVGVIGRHGGGSPDYHGCEGQIDIVMGSFDKALGGTGGYLCGRRELIAFLRVAANASVLSSALPCSMAGAMLTAIDLVEGGQTVRQELADKSRYLATQLRDRGFTILGSDPIPSVPLLIGEEVMAVRFADALREEGIYCPVMRWPAVHFGRARFRFSIMAAHEQKHLDRLVEACERVADRLAFTRTDVMPV